MFKVSNISFKGNSSKKIVNNLKKVENTRLVDLSGYARFGDLTSKQKIAATECLLNELEYAAGLNIPLLKEVPDALKNVLSDNSKAAIDTTLAKDLF